MTSIPSEKPQATASGKIAYWKDNVRVIWILLTIWALVSLGASVLFVPILKNINFGQLPLYFWFAHQGAIITFVILIFVYAFIMDRLDRKHNVEE